MTNPLQSLLDKAGLSQREAGKHFDIAQQTLNRWCSDEAPDNIVKLVRMLVALLKRRKQLQLYATFPGDVSELVKDVREVWG